MKKLKKILLINWLYFSKELIEAVSYTHLRLPVTETGAVCYTLFVLFIHVFSSSRAIICGDF